MKRERLYFSGTRRRATRYVGVQTQTKNRLGEQPTVVSRFAILASDGQGQSYELDRPDSFWRSFSEIDLTDRRADIFVQRYGCPLGVLGTTSPEYDLSLWLPVQLPLRAAAQVWSPADAAGISRCDTDTARTEHAARALVQGMPMEVWDETRLVPSSADPLEPQPRALTLQAFMVLSALYDLRNANSMRRCSLCGSWFTMRRTGALYCSQSCNVSELRRQRITQALLERMASDGDNSQDHN